MTKKKKSKPNLFVVFDTSVLFTQVAYNLVRSEVRHLIEMNSQHSDLSIKWYLPNIVIDERRYQMQNKAFELLPSIEKLEKLLGHNLNITTDILIVRVNEAIDKQLEELNISTLDIDTSEVDWKALMNRAVYRLPPFESGETEKGFRDSIIAETFLQLFRKSPKTPSVCRLAIVANDKLLSEYTRVYTKDAKNVRVLYSISELESLINTLVSEVTEEFVGELEEKARRYFFEEENQNCLFYKEKIRAKINSSYKQELEKVPREGLLRENGTWWINPPVFLKKESRRIFYMTPILVNTKLFRFESSTSDISNILLLDSDADQLHAAPSLGSYPRLSFSSIGQSFLNLGQNDTLQNPSQFSGASLSGIAMPSVDYFGEQNTFPNRSGTQQNISRKVKVSDGQSRFEVHWSANITQNKKLTVPRIDKIQFVSTKWGEE